MTRVSYGRIKLERAAVVGSERYDKGQLRQKVSLIPLDRRSL